MIRAKRWSDAWEDAEGPGPNGERLVSKRRDGRAYVTVHGGVSYAAYLEDNPRKLYGRSGGWSMEHKAQQHADRELRKAERKS